jgi:hypothetical protein
MSRSDFVDELGGIVTAKDEVQVEHRLSCHRYAAVVHHHILVKDLV